MRNLRQEYIHAQNEVKRIASIPLMIGHFLEGIDATTCIVAPTSGQNFYVRILSTVDREKLKPSAAVCLHKFSHSLVDVLPPESDSSIQDRFNSNLKTRMIKSKFSVNRHFQFIESSGESKYSISSFSVNRNFRLFVIFDDSKFSVNQNFRSIEVFGVFNRS